MGLKVDFDNHKYLKFYNFFKDAFNVLEPSTPLQLNWHHKYLCDTLEKEVYRIYAKRESEGDIIINVPFRSTKSLITTVMLPAWAWIIDPSQSFLTVSYSQKLSTNHSRLSRKLINSNWYQHNFGHCFKITSDQNVKSEYENNKSGKRLATSMTGSATGDGGDFIIVDDPLNPKESASDIERDRANTNYSETFFSRTKNPHTAVRIIIMQRLHEQDLTGYLLKKDPEKHKHINIPGKLNDKVKPENLKDNYKDGLFWYDRFTNELLKRYKNALGSYGYSGQIMQDPSPQEGGEIKKHWFKTSDNIPEGIVNFTIDPAYTNKEKNDPSGLLAYIKTGNEVFIREAVQVWMEFPELCRFIQSWTKKNGYSSQSRIYVEPKASGKSIAQTLRKNTMLNIAEDKPPTKDKLARVRDVTPLIESKRVTLYNDVYKDNFLSECAVFPNGEHDDMVDCLVIALNRALKKKIIVV